MWHRSEEAAIYIQSQMQARRAHVYERKKKVLHVPQTSHAENSTLSLTVKCQGLPFIWQLKHQPDVLAAIVLLWLSYADDDLLFNL